jgi:cyclopropane fatty-acyl-phospholipid synthase-like methyltransferase
MPISDEEITRRYPRSRRYPTNWVTDQPMGPNVLWLTEAATQFMSITPGMRVLDLGAGRAHSSMFVAREFQAQVWAADLWIKPTENYERVQAEGMARSVFPLSAEAHTLPFAEEFFDAMVSMDAYHYFGTNDLYARYVAKFLRHGAEIGIVVPGVREELEEVPGHLRPYWEPDFSSFHTSSWWKRNFERSGEFRVVKADLLEDGAALWIRWHDMCVEAGNPAHPERQMLIDDDGRNLGFVRIVAVRK